MSQESVRQSRGFAGIQRTVLRAVTLAMGVASLALLVMDAIDARDAAVLLSIGVVAMGMNSLQAP